MYTLNYNPDWDTHYSKMDSFTQEKIWKKIQKQKEETKTRHLRHGIEFYVAEQGQYRIALKINEDEKTKTIWFVGNHKQYEAWYKSLQ